MAEEMRTRERTRKGKESVAFSHGLGGEDASTAADMRDSGEQLCFSPAAILPEIRGERGRRWWGRMGCGWGSRLVSGYRGEVGGIGAASVTRGEKKLPELMMLTGGSHLSLVAEGREGGVRAEACFGCCSGWLGPGHGPVAAFPFFCSFFYSFLFLLFFDNFCKTPSKQFKQNSKSF
jgi:hypothetical protein